jgi:hypothetical protein
MSNLPSSVLSDLKLSFFQVHKQIAPSHVLNYNINILRVLKYVQQPDDVRVLTDLEYFYLSLLKFKLVKLHIFLLYTLDSNFLLSFLMYSESDLPKLSSTKIPLNLVKVLNAGVPNGLFNDLHPFVSLVLSQQVIGATLIRWENQLKGVEDHHLTLVVDDLFWFGLHVSTCQVVHTFVTLIITLPVAVKLFA